MAVIQKGTYVDNLFYRDSMNQNMGIYLINGGWLIISSMLPRDYCHPPIMGILNSASQSKGLTEGFDWPDGFDEGLG